MKIILILFTILTSAKIEAQEFIPDEKLYIYDFILPEIINKNQIQEITIEEYFEVENIDKMKIPKVTIKYNFDEKGSPKSKTSIFLEGYFSEEFELSECNNINRNLFNKYIECDDFGRIILAYNNDSLAFEKNIYNEYKKITSSIYSRVYGEGRKLIWKTNYYYSNNQLDSIVQLKGYGTWNYQSNTNDTLFFEKTINLFFWENNKISKMTSDYIVSGSKVQNGFYYITFEYLGDLLYKVEMKEEDDFLTYRAIFKWK